MHTCDPGPRESKARRPSIQGHAWLPRFVSKTNKKSRTLMKTLFKAVEMGTGPVVVREEDSVPGMIRACKCFS